LARNDAIIVSFNYRLGALGWTSMDHISSDLKGTANLGILDQISKYRNLITTSIKKLKEYK
jgi:para-nitrobenzyl esterase